MINYSKTEISNKLYNKLCADDIMKKLTNVDIKIDNITYEEANDYNRLGYKHLLLSIYDNYIKLYALAGGCDMENIYNMFNESNICACIIKYKNGETLVENIDKNDIGDSNMLLIEISNKINEENDINEFYKKILKISELVI